MEQLTNTFKIFLLNDSDEQNEESSIGDRDFVPHLKRSLLQMVSIASNAMTTSCLTPMKDPLLVEDATTSKMLTQRQ
jgi:hypothetical protein